MKFITVSATLMAVAGSALAGGHGTVKGPASLVCPGGPTADGLGCKPYTLAVRRVGSNEYETIHAEAHHFSPASGHAHHARGEFHGATHGHPAHIEPGYEHHARGEHYGAAHGGEEHGKDYAHHARGEHHGAAHGGKDHDGGRW